MIQFNAKQMTLENRWFIYNFLICIYFKSLFLVLAKGNGILKKAFMFELCLDVAIMNDFLNWVFEIFYPGSFSILRFIATIVCEIFQDKLTASLFCKQQNCFCMSFKKFLSQCFCTLLQRYIVSLNRLQSLKM